MTLTDAFAVLGFLAAAVAAYFAYPAWRESLRRPRLYLSIHALPNTNAYETEIVKNGDQNQVVFGLVLHNAGDREAQFWRLSIRSRDHGTMILDPKGLIDDFIHAVAAVGLKPLGSKVEHEGQPGPHHRHALPVGKCAAYVFSLTEQYGRQCPAGAHRVLKVGMAGLNSNARFQSQHYNPRSAGSTVAGVLLQSRVLWPYLGIRNLREDEAGAWLRENADRDNFYLDAADAELLRDLERYVRATLGPVLEGG